ncbi:hypothetical protein A3C37_04250 [Candidatus Peribacteria bacterium RIFCSPHIGHO2_02_FULL_53_20]|nr:MAG: hypothetical protein A3C37_04250 [Candidatus Peribacteria bacterium RIFCSPHIGHO2_02_FULL_53_20]
MSDSFLDHIPSYEREKIRKRMRSPEEYERLREKVKGPEDLEREMKKSEQMAEAHFRIETEPETAERLHDRIAKDLKERGVEAVLENADVSESVKVALEKGNFGVSVETHPKTHEDVLVVLPEGNIQDKLPVKPVQSEHYIQSLLVV